MTDWRARRVLVTGATGTVGSWLVRDLLGRGACVVTLVRDTDPQSELVRSGTIARTSVVSGALEEFASVERAVNEHDVDTIFHLGAQTIVGTAHRSPLPTLQANIMGTAHVLEAARLHSELVRAVVVASSDKAYGHQDQLPYLESMPLAGKAPYEVSKSCTDLLSLSYAETYGLPVTIARCGNIYGGGDLNWSRIIPGTIRSLFRKERPVLRSDGTFLRDYLYVEDVVSAYRVLAENIGRPEVAGKAFNFSPERALSVLEIYRAVCEATVGHVVEPEILNSAAGEIHDQYLDATLAADVLGWRAEHSLDEGLERTVAWYRELFAADAGS